MVGERNDGDDDYKHQLRTCVVLGGRGFIGRSLVLRLLRLGNWFVRIADSDESIQLDLLESDSPLSDALSDGRALYFHVDVRNKPQIVQAIQGSSVVFYVEDVEIPRNDLYLHYTVIVQGAKNVINACRDCKVKQLVYNSTADVVFETSRDLCNADESLPYAGRRKDIFTDVKAHAEALVLSANDIDGLLTCVLRPSIVFGPGDKHLMPHLVKIAKSNWAKFIIGSGEHMSDFTYVENVAHAHICAEEALDSRMVSVSGKVFHITNLEPMRFWEFVSLIRDGLGYPSAMIKLPTSMVWHIFMIVKWVLLRLGFRKLDKFMSIYDIVQLASHTRTFNCSAAQKYLGYSPVVSLEEGVRFTVEAFSHLKDSAFVEFSDFDEQGKVEKVLGSGRVADLLLWRDEKRTFMSFLVLALLYYWFFLCGTAFISSIAKLLLVILVGLFAYGNLPSYTFGETIPRITLSAFEISEVDVKNSVATVAYIWNCVYHVMRSVALGEDWNLFLKVVGILYIIKLIVSYSLTVTIGVVLVLAFTSFFFYEQYEVTIDVMAVALLNAARKTIEVIVRNLPTPAILKNIMLNEKRAPLT